MNAQNSGPKPGLLLVPRRQHPLDDGLVAAPIPDAHHRIAQQEPNQGCLLGSPGRAPC